MNTIELKQKYLIDNAYCDVILGKHDKNNIIRKCVYLILEAHAISRDKTEKIAYDMIQREDCASTGIGKGIAMPHVKTYDVNDTYAGWFAVPEGIDFFALDRQPSYGVFCMITGGDPEKHLLCMEGVFQIIKDDSFRQSFFAAESPEVVKTALKKRGIYLWRENSVE